MMKLIIVHVRVRARRMMLNECRVMIPSISLSISHFLSHPLILSFILSLSVSHTLILSLFLYAQREADAAARKKASDAVAAAAPAASRENPQVMRICSRLTNSI